ncbi:MAG TPA: glycosyltransferase [Acidimicrobiales bacterium]|nr:glycosyltransferase [Acidimicrobiales bacterium]
MAVLNATNFVFHFVISRDLDPGSYGALGALLGIILVLTVPAAALQIVVTREVASRRGTETGPVIPLAAGTLLAEAVLWGTGAALVLAALAPLLTSFLHLPSASTALLLAAYVVPVAIGLVPKAVLLGEMRFGLVALSTVVGGVMRLFLGIFLVRAGAGLNGAIGASVLGAIAEAIVLLPAMRSMLTEAEDVPPLRARWSDTSSALMAMVGFWLFSGIGTLLARHYLSRAGSGFYAAAWTAATAAMFLPGAVSFIAFPRFVAAGPAARAKAVLLQALAVVGLLAFGAAAAAVLGSSLIIRILFGDDYAASTAVVGILSVAGAFLAVAGLLMQFHLARQARGAASMSWLGILLAAGLGMVFHSTTLAVAVVMLACSASVAGLMLWAAFSSDGELDPSASYVGRDLWDLPEADRDVTIVVPFYNPGPRFRPNIDRLVEVLSSSGSSFEIVAVSDGCTDGSEHSLEGVDEELVRCVGLARNRGKGQALRVGLAMGRGRYLGFIDADGDLDPTLLLPLLELVQIQVPDVVLGSKRHPESAVDYPGLRRLYSWGYQLIIRVLFHLDVKDTQTGLKLVRREVLAEALPRMVEKRFAFDLELFVVARRLGWTQFVEAPVAIKERFSSTISIRTVWPMLVDTLAIFYRLRILGFYGPAVRRRPADQHSVVAG